MLKTTIKMMFVTIVVVGSATVASAQGFDPNGANRFQRLIHAGTAGFYIGQVQGPMAAAAMADPLMAAQVGLQLPWHAPQYQGRVIGIGRTRGPVVAPGTSAY